MKEMLKIHTIPDPILRKEATKAKPTDQIRALAEEMHGIQKKSQGIGLAAPQVGQSVKLFVMGVDKNKPGENFPLKTIWLNPKIINKSTRNMLGVEGCLSVPNIELAIERFDSATVAGQDEFGHSRTVTYNGYGAQVAQHEIDHLNGILFIDRNKPFRVILMGSPAVAVPMFAKIFSHPGFEVVAVISETDKPKGRGMRLTPTAVKTWAEAQKLPVSTPAKLDPTTITEIAKLAPDLIVVIAYNKILPKALLDVPRFGCVNVHFSLLPKYRGAAPVQATILNGDKQTGVTVMKMDEGLDTGPIINQAAIDIKSTETAGELSLRMAETGQDFAVSTLIHYIGNALTLKNQPAEGSRVKKLNKEFGKIDWAASPEAQERLIRAMQPWPGAYFEAGEERVKILKAHLDGRRLHIDTVQRPGGKPISAPEYKRWASQKQLTIPF